MSDFQETSQIKMLRKPGNLRKPTRSHQQYSNLIYIYNNYSSKTMYSDKQMLVGKSSEKWWPLYKYWPQGSFARIFHQLLGIDNQNRYAIDGIF